MGENQDQTISDGKPAPATASGKGAGLWVKFLNALLVIAVTLGVFGFDLWLFTRNNQFPASWHPDEPGKVHQILSDSRNFRHPQLMLEATDLWRTWHPTGDGDQEVVVAGREVSAFFCAAAAAALALTCYLAAGWWGMLFGVILLGLAPPLVTFSHYMKEDASLVFGLALTVLASRLVWSTRRWWLRIPCWAFLGAACALAVSGKYVGAMALVMPAMLVFFAPGLRWWSLLPRIIMVLASLLLCAGVVNHRTLNPHLDLHSIGRLWSQPSDYQRIIFTGSALQGMGEEIEHGTTSHWGMAARTPHLYMIRTAIRHTWPWAPIAAALFPLVVLVTWRHGWGWEAALFLFVEACAIVLSFSAILFPRYALPLMVFLHLLAALSLARLVVASGGRPVLQATLGILSAGLLLALLLTTSMQFTRNFADDSRLDLRRWCIASFAADGARIYADSYAELDGAMYSYRPRIQVYSDMFAAHFGTVKQLGNCYVVICDLAYQRYLEPEWADAPGYEQQNQRCREFYKELLEKHTPVWESKPARDMGGFTNPRLLVYHLPK